MDTLIPLGEVIRGSVPPPLVTAARSPAFPARYVTTLAALAILAGASCTQPPANRFDTAGLTGDAAAVYRTWRTYLESKHGRYSAGAHVPSPLWSSAERRRWPLYDLVGAYLPDGAEPEVIGLERVAGADEYRITTRFFSGDPEVRPAKWETKLTTTVYAVREGDDWRLGNALPRNTRAWRRDTVGPITYVFAPGYPYDRARAERAVAFTDSLADAFGVPRLAPLTYYLTSSVDEVYAIMGLESDVKFGPVGGAAQPVNRQLFSGIPAVGEDYRHELAHLVLAPLVSARTSFLMSEGVPTWLGGTTGMDFPAAARELAKVLVGRPAVSLDSVVASRLPSPQLYAGAAVLVAMTFERGGTGAVKELFDAGAGDELRASLERLLGHPWPSIAADWRARVIAFGDPSKR